MTNELNSNLQWSVEEELAFKTPIQERYELEGHPYYASARFDIILVSNTARLWDDGIIMPQDTRNVIALTLG